MLTGQSKAASRLSSARAQATPRVWHPLVAAADATSTRRRESSHRLSPRGDPLPLRGLSARLAGGGRRLGRSPPAPGSLAMTNAPHCRTSEIPSRSGVSPFFYLLVYSRFPWCQWVVRESVNPSVYTRFPRCGGARTLSHGAGMIIARSRSSWHRPKDTTVSSRDGMASTRSGGPKIQAQCRGDRRESRDETPGLEQGRETSVGPVGTGHNYSRSSISAEGTAGNSPGIHSWGSGAGADMRSPEFRRDGGGSAGLVFRRPCGTRDECSLPSAPGLRLWLRPGQFPVVPTGLGGDRMWVLRGESGRCSSLDWRAGRAGRRDAGLSWPVRGRGCTLRRIARRSPSHRPYGTR